MEFYMASHHEILTQFSRTKAAVNESSALRYAVSSACTALHCAVSGVQCTHWHSHLARQMCSARHIVLTCEGSVIHVNTTLRSRQEEHAAALCMAKASSARWPGPAFVLVCIPFFNKYPCQCFTR